MHCPSGVMVATEDSKSFAARRGGSSPSWGTILNARLVKLVAAADLKFASSGVPVRVRQWAPI